MLQDAAQGPDAVPDSTTTESESVSDVQLLRAGGDERTIFKLTLQVWARLWQQVPVALAAPYRVHPHMSLTFKLSVKCRADM